jgi:anti-sigma28 factor (negative regulator of flagellin synthesis)
MSADSEDKKHLATIPRKRSLTSLSLQWLAERMRKAERIKAEIAAGKYSVSSADVAESLVSEPSDPHEVNMSDNKSS